MGTVTLNPLQQAVPIVNPETGVPTPYFIQQMLLLSQGEADVIKGEYPSASITVDSIGRLTNVTNNGGLVLLDKQVLVTTTASLTFTVDSKYVDLVIAIHGRGDTAAATVALKAQFNGDTGANYYSDRVNRLANVQVAAGTSADIGVITGSTATAGNPGVVEATLPNFSSSVFNKAFSYTGYYNNVAAPTATYGGGQWMSTVPITSILIFPSAGNFIAGTTVSVYGRGF